MTDHPNQDWVEVRSILDRWHEQGSRVLNNGAELICHVPHVAPEAWFHTLYAPLTEADIKLLEADLGVQLPLHLSSLYCRTNGLKAFSDELAVYGLRRNYIRTGDDARQPYEVREPNTYFSLPGWQRGQCLVVGSYREDASPVLYPNRSGSEIARVDRGTGEVLARWPSLWVWLRKELERLATLYDERGRRIAEMHPGVRPTRAAEEKG